MLEKIGINVAAAVGDNGSVLSSEAKRLIANPVSSGN